MSTIKQENQVVYVEPNAMDDYTTYNTNEGKVYKSTELEDLCISVDLEVEVKGRTYSTSKNASSNNLQMQWQSSANGQTVRFMEGTKIYTDKSKDTFVNSLTTNYTDCHLYDVVNDGTCEMFGIKSIDISYNNFMVPEVTIQFIDVRGVSLFAQEEMRHNITKNGMTGVANNSIEGSFFKCFFTFPYPKFTLRVKGFYGEMVSYELTCSDFRAAFDSMTGNFNVTAKFIGYAFSFLNDIMTNALLAAPYCEYVGKQYWDDNNGTRFKISNSNGAEVPMTKLGEICKKYKEIQAQVEQEIKDKGASTVVRETGGGEQAAQAVEDADLKELKDGYTACINKLSGHGVEKPKKGDTPIHPSGTNSYAFITNDDDKRLDSYIKDFEAFAELIKTKQDKCEALKNWVNGQNHKFEIIKFDDYGDIVSNDQIKSESVPEQVLRDEIQSYIGKDCPHNTGHTWNDLWEDGDDSTVYIYQDFGLKSILGPESSVSGDTQSQATQAVEEAEQKLVRKYFEDAFDFPPTVENITKIIMAHFETYVQCISKCASTIIDSNRTTESLGVSIEPFDDAKGNRPSDDASTNVEIPPFPSVTKKVDLDGVSKTEDAWIGEFGGQDKFEEISLIEGLLRGIESASEDINKASASSSESSEEQQKSSVKNILSYLDLFMKDSDNPFGNVKVDSLDDVFGRFCVRAFACMSTQDTDDIDAGTFGKLDAETFYEKYGNNSNIGKLRDGLANLTSDKVYEFVKTGTARLEPEAKSNPWYSATNLVASPDGKVCNLGVGQFAEDGVIIPVKNWNWKEWNDTYKYRAGIKTNNLVNYTLNYTPNNINDANARIITSMDAPVTYMSQSYNSLSNSTYATDGVKKIFSDIQFDKSKVLQVAYFHEAKFVKSGDDSKVKYNEILDFTNSGRVNGADKIAYVFPKNVFMTENYYSLGSDVEKAAYFLLNSMPKNASATYLQFDSKKTVFKYMPKFVLLQMGAQLWTNKKTSPETVNRLRPTIQNYFIGYFTNWVNENFTPIKNSFELNFKDNITYSTFTKSLKGLSGNALEEKIKASVKDWSVFSKIYKVKSYTTQLNCDTLVCQNMTDLINELFQVTAVCCMTKFNKKNFEWDDDDAPVLEVGKLKAYFDGVITVLKEKLGEPESSSSGDTTAQTTLALDPDDIKIGVYNYIKMLYDKWISADLDNANYKMERMFYDDDCAFHFIDSVYNRVGKTLYINIGTLVDILVSSQTQNGYSMLSMMSGLYASNKFTFMCLQNFADLANSDMLTKMFKPIPYIGASSPDNHPDFVVLYPYEASSHLDVEGADYPDDTFYLNESTTWPVMISEKQASNGYPIPAFGVNYGQQYQNYFKNIQVDMNTPMATEQSIKAKFLVCGANTDGEDNGPREITIGQDLYTIYSNNSYTCTVTMMGCAWVQPMMYFVLNNVPMFRGSYMICKVNHQIEAGNMVTTFKGVRMAKTATRAVRDYIYGRTSDSTDGSNNIGENASQKNANVGNDCDYGYSDPLTGGGTVGGNVNVATPDSGEPAAYCKAAYNAFVSAGLTSNQAKGVCANIYAESGFDPYTIGIDGNKQSDPDPYHCVGGGLCGFLGVDKSGRHSGGAVGLFMYAYNESESQAKKRLQDLTAKVEPYWNGRVCSEETKQNIAKAGIKWPIAFDVQVKYVCTLFNKYSGIKTAKSAAEATKIWQKQYEKPQKITNRWASQGSKVEKALQSNATVSQNTKEPTTNNTSKPDVSTYMKGIKDAVQASLRASNYYTNTTVEYVEGKNYWMKLTAKGSDNVTNAMFDCLLETYYDWHDYIYWDIGTGAINSNATSVILHVAKTPPNNHVIGVSANHNVKDGKTPDAKKLTKKEDVNETLRLAMVKFFSKKSITEASKAKALFKSIVSMDDTTVKTVFELDKDSANDSIQDCNTLMGSSSDGGTWSGTITTDLPTQFKKGDTKNYNLVLVRYKKCEATTRCSSKSNCSTHNGVTGMIYEFETKKILCYTIEDAQDIARIGGRLSVGMHKIMPGGSSWCSKKGYHRGCSSYTVKLSGGKAGFGSSTGAPNTMLKITNSGEGGCLFHPGANHAWSEGCILVGTEADAHGDRKLNSNEFLESSIQTSNDPNVVMYRNFYNSVISQMLAGKEVRIQIIESSKPGVKEDTSKSSQPNQQSQNGLVSLSETLTKAGYKKGVDFDMVISYATNQNFTKKRINGYSQGQNDTLASKTMADKVVKAMKHMKSKYGNTYKLAVMDCYRPKEACYAMHEYCVNSGHKSWLGTYVAKAPKGSNPSSAHNKGNAIDITLKKSDGSYVNMNAGSGTGPGGFDEFSSKAHYDASIANQKLLHDIMVSGGGLKAYSKEWWHFSC